MADFDLITNKGKCKIHLDDIGVSTLPDQPGKRGFTAEEVKSHFKEPIDYLFSLLVKSAEQTSETFDAQRKTIADAMEKFTKYEDYLGKSVLFTPALQESPPDSDTVKVWFQPSEGIPKEQSVIDLDLETNELSVDGESLALASDDEPSLSLGEDSQSLTLGDDEGMTLETEDTTIKLE